MTRSLRRALAALPPFVVISLFAQPVARGQDAPPVPPENPYAHRPVTGAATSAPPARDGRADAARSEERPVEESARAETESEPPPPAPARRTDGAARGEGPPAAEPARVAAAASAPPARERRADDAVRDEERPIEELAHVATESAPPPPPPTDAFGALDEVLAGDSTDPIAGVEAAASDPATVLAGGPSREETAAAMERVTPRVRACATDQAGRVVQLRVVFAASGHVTTAVVVTASAPLSPRQRSCVARAARGAL